MAIGIEFDDSDFGFIMGPHKEYIVLLILDFAYKSNCFFKEIWNLVFADE